MNQVIVKLQEAYSTCLTSNEELKRRLAIVDAREQELNKKESDLRVNMGNFAEREKAVSKVEGVLNLKNELEKMTAEFNSDRAALSDERKEFRIQCEAERGKIKAQSDAIAKDWADLRKKEAEIAVELDRRVNDIISKLKG